jgi:alkylhydroperoxidase family enzyme
VDTAPLESVGSMQWLANESNTGPYSVGVLANSPVLINGYVQLKLHLINHSALSLEHEQIIRVSVAHAHGCQYSMAMHCVDWPGSSDAYQAISENKPLMDPVSEHLRDLTLLLVRNQGRITTEQVNKFHEIGFSKQAILDIVACIVAEMIGNFSNQLAMTPIESGRVSLTDGLPYREERDLLHLQDRSL